MDIYLTPFENIRNGEGKIYPVNKQIELSANEIKGKSQEDIEKLFIKKLYDYIEENNIQPLPKDNS